MKAKPLLLAMLLICAPAISLADAFTTNYFFLYDGTDPTKLIWFDATGVPTGTGVTIKAPNYSGTGVVPLPVDEGGTNFLLMSGGSGNAPTWDNTHLAYSGGIALVAAQVPYAVSANAVAGDADMAFATDSLLITRLNCGKTLRLGGSNATNSIPFILTAAGSQASDLSQWLDSGGTMRNRIDASGGANYAKLNATAQTADITTTNLATSMQAGQYHIDVYIENTTTDVTAGIVTLTLAWTDDVGATTDATVTQDLTGLAARRAALSRNVYLASGNITYATAHSGIFGTSAYALRIRLTYLGS